MTGFVITRLFLISSFRFRLVSHQLIKNQSRLGEQYGNHLNNFCTFTLLTINFSVQTSMLYEKGVQFRIGHWIYQQRFLFQAQLMESIWTTCASMSIYYTYNYSYSIYYCYHLELIFFCFLCYCMHTLNIAVVR